MTSLRLRDIESQNWRMTHAGGLMDVLFGFMLLGACVSSLVGILGAPKGIRLLSLFVVQFGGVGWMVWMRRTAIRPRIGHAQFSQRRRKDRRTLRIILAVCAVLTASLVAVTAFGSGGRELSALGAWLLITAIILIPAGAMAIVLDYPRLMLHASLFVIAHFLLTVVRVDAAFRYSEPLVFGVGSLISFAIGIPILVKFLRRFPPISSSEQERSNA